MTSCRGWRHHLVEAVYGELEGERAAALERHLDSCPRCSAQLDGLRATAQFVDRSLPPRPQGDALDVWRHIRPAIEALERPAAAPRRLVLGVPAAAACAAALMALGLGLGMLSRPPATVTAASTPAVSASIPPAPAAASHGADPDAAFARFLERATPLLLAVANRQAGGGEVASFDPAAERALAERLAAEASRLGDQLQGRHRRRQADLLADLEIVFLQMANLPRREYRRGIEIVQSTIEGRALLFQLSVEQMRRL